MVLNFLKINIVKVKPKEISAPAKVKELREKINPNISSKYKEHITNPTLAEM